MFKHRYFILMLLALVFIAPGLLAVFFYHHPEWMGNRLTNKGTLLNPPIQMAFPGDGSKWRLILWRPEGCEKRCLQQLDQLGRVRLALGRRLYQVESWLLYGDAENPLSEAVAEMLQEADIHSLKYQPNKAGSESVLPNHAEIYLMNPAGFLVLAYQTTTKPDHIYHDLKRVLNIKEQ